jgi:hypothetical protein
MQSFTAPAPEGAKSSLPGASDAHAPPRPLDTLAAIEGARSRWQRDRQSGRDLRSAPVAVLLAHALGGGYGEDQPVISSILTVMATTWEAIADAKSTDKAGPVQVSVDLIRYQAGLLAIVEELYLRERGGGARRGRRFDDLPPPEGDGEYVSPWMPPTATPEDERRAEAQLYGEMLLDNSDDGETRVSPFHRWAMARDLRVVEAWSNLHSIPGLAGAPSPTMSDILSALSWPRELAAAARYVSISATDAVDLLTRALAVAVEVHREEEVSP